MAWWSRKRTFFLSVCLSLNSFFFFFPLGSCFCYWSDFCACFCCLSLLSLWIIMPWAYCWMAPVLRFVSTLLDSWWNRALKGSCILKFLKSLYCYVRTYFIYLLFLMCIDNHCLLAEGAILKRCLKLNTMWQCRRFYRMHFSASLN